MSITKFKIALLVLLVFVSSVSLHAEITKNDAEDLILNQILSNDIGNVDVYVKNTSITIQDGLEMYNDESQMLVPTYDNNWGFFINDTPSAMWHHPCRYVFIDVATGAYQVIDKTIYPKNLEDDFELISYAPRPEVLDVPQDPNPVIPARDPDDHLYAVIIGQHDGLYDSRLWNPVSGIYCTLLERYGYTKDNTFVHFGENGTSGVSDDLDGPPPSDDIDYCAQEWRIKRTLRNLSGEETNDPNVPELGTDDQLFIFVCTHGFNSDGHSYISLPGSGDLKDTELRDCVRYIDCAQMIFVLLPCYSGGFIDELANDNLALCKNRVVHTSCEENESAYFEGHITGYRYPEFAFYWTAAARGYYPLIMHYGPSTIVIEPWNHGSFTGNFTFSMYHTMIDHPGDYDPDTNGDHDIQMGEAFDYTNNLDTWSPYGYYCPYSGSYDEFPKNSTEIGFQEDLLTLSGLGGIVRNTQTVIGNFLVSDGLTINPLVILTISDNSNIYHNSNSSLYIRPEATLIIENQSNIHLNNPSWLTLDGTSTCILNNHSNCYVNENSHIDVGTSGSPATFTLSDHSKVYVYNNSYVKLNRRSLFEINNNSEFRLEPGSSLYGTKHTVWEDPATGQRYDTWEEAYENVPEIGAEHAIPGDRIIVNNSSFNALGDSTNRITISSVGSDYFWDGIELNDNSPSHFNYCDVSNLNFIKVNFSGLLFENSTFSNGSQIIAKNNSGLNIDNSTFDNLNACPIVSYESINQINNCTITNNNGNGISIFYPSSQCGNISGNTIKYNEYWGISYYDTHIQSFNNDISENISHGVVAQGSMGSAVLAGNIIENNGGAEIIGDRRCYPNLTSFIGIYGPNTIYDEYDPDGYNYLDQYLLMCGRYDEIPIDVRDNIFPNENDLDFEDRFHPFYDAYIFDGEKPPEKVLYDQGISLINNNEFEPAKLTMKDIVNNYPETGTAENALQLLMYLEKFRGHDYEDLRVYIETIDDFSYPHLERTKYNTITSTYVAEEDYVSAITRLEAILANPPSEPDSIFAYIDEGYCYLKLDEEGGKAAPVECKFKPRSFNEFKYVSQNLTKNLLDKAIPTSEPPTTDPQTIEFALHQNYPNPTSLSTTFSFSIPANTNIVELKIYNLKGQLVKTFQPDTINRGTTNEITWDCKDDNGKTLRNGIYFYKLTADKNEIVKKMIIMK